MEARSTYMKFILIANYFYNFYTYKIILKLTYSYYSFDMLIENNCLLISQISSFKQFHLIFLTEINWPIATARFYRIKQSSTFVCFCNQFRTKISSIGILVHHLPIEIRFESKQLGYIELIFPA
jgi:hypothetical protein